MGVKTAGYKLQRNNSKHKTMRKYFLLLITGAFFLTAQTGQAQSVEEWVRAADKVFTQKDYYTAYRYYGIAGQYKPDRPDILYQYAESARLFGIYVKAESAYQRVIDLPGQAAAYPLAKYHLARVKQTLGKYDEAVGLFQQFLSENPNADSELQTIARKGLADCEWSKGQVRKEKEVGILSASVNSAYSEYGVAFKGDTMYYSSLKFVYDKDTTNPRRTYSKILQSIAGAPGVPLPENVNVTGKHVGHTAFSEGYKKVYYTICDYINAADVRCDIYASPVNADGSWGPAEKLSVNAPGANTTQPSIGRDGQTGRYRLYFASDRDGGKGNLDIWYSNFNDDGSLSTPENLSSINTEGNDVTPFFQETSQTLYFSTDGYHTLGGYDIHKSRKEGTGWAAPENLGAPLNSSYNDLYYAVFEGGAKAYLSSNRPDTAAFYWDKTKETCCNDLYAITYDMSVRLLVTTYNNLDQSPLAGATVELFEVTPDGREILAGTQINPDSNHFEFPLERGKNYLVKASRDGFGPASTPVDATNLPEGNQVIERKLYLEPPIQLDVLTFENIDSTALTGVTVELFERGANGDVLVKTLLNTSSNDFTFALERGKKYTLRGKRDGYAGAVDIVDVSGPEMKTVRKLQRKLYLGQLLEALTIDAKTRAALAGATVELYDISGPTPVLKGKKTNSTGNDFLFPLALNKPYLIKASRPGYNSVEEELSFDAETVNNSGGRITIEIPLDRFGFDDFLPIALYFDNDQPNPRTYGKTTTLTYQETNTAYYARKAEYIKEFTAGLSAEEKFLTERRFFDFFDREVDGSRQELEAFTEKLLEFLENGGSIRIGLKGYSSPRGASTYNALLSARRIDAVKNHFRKYKNGALLPFMQANNRKLRIEEEALGESTAKKSVSARLDDRRNSIFSVVACVERRVEIVEVKTADQR